RQALLDNLLGQRCRIGRRYQRARVPRGNLAIGHHLADVSRQLQEPQRVGDMRPGLADDLREVLLCVGELVDQLLVSLRFLERIEIDTLDILDNCELERFLVVDLANDYGDVMESGSLRSAPAALASNDFEDI